MIFNCWDYDTKALVFKYTEPGDDHICERIENFDFTENRGICGENDRFFTSKYHKESNLIFAFCIDKVKVRKQADFFVKHAINMYLSTNPAVESKQKQYEKIVKTSVHNTKNLNSQITSKILSHLNEKKLANSTNKVRYIETLITSDSHLFAKEVLSILKISSQISSEYNVIDYLKPNIVIPKTEFSYGKVHSLIVLAFYHFEYDFSKKNIRVNIGKTQASGFFNFNTIQTVLIHILGNALRYCKPNGVINIGIEEVDDMHIDIEFKMTSLYLTDFILGEGLLSGKRSKQAEKMHPKGSGIGLGVIKKLAELNRGSFTFGRINDRKIYDNDYEYGNNIFKIRLLKNEFYN